MKPNFLTIDPEADINVLKGLASPIRIRILKLLRSEGRLNVNDISHRLGLPQSTVAINVQTLEEAGLIATEAVKAKKGHQKICSARFDEIIVRFETDELRRDPDVVEVAMPLGLFTSVEVGAPCGLCSTDGVIGLLDVPDSFLDPARVQAALIWFGRGNVEYKFPNNAKLLNAAVESVEFSMELSSETPGTNMDWPSDITLWVNDVSIGTWTSPGDYGDKRGVYTPSWWKLAGSQYGKLKTWRISAVRLLHRRRPHFQHDHGRPRYPQASFDPPAGRHRRQGSPPRRHQHLRTRLRQLRPGHRHAAAAEALSGRRLPAIGLATALNTGLREIATLSTS